MVSIREFKFDDEYEYEYTNGQKTSNYAKSWSRKMYVKKKFFKGYKISQKKLKHKACMESI